MHFGKKGEEIPFSPLVSPPCTKAQLLSTSATPIPDGELQATQEIRSLQAASPHDGRCNKREDGRLEGANGFHLMDPQRKESTAFS